MSSPELSVSISGGLLCPCPGLLLPPFKLLLLLSPCLFQLLLRPLHSLSLLLKFLPNFFSPLCLWSIAGTGATGAWGGAAGVAGVEAGVEDEVAPVMILLAIAAALALSRAMR